VSAVSAGLISFSFGAHALNTLPYNNESPELGTAEDWQFGGEMRLGVLFAEGSVSGVYDASNDMITGLITVGTSLSVFDLLHLGVGVGPAFAVTMADGEVDWAYMDDSGSTYPASDIGGVFDNGLIHYRAHGDMKLGRLSFGLTLQVPSDGYTMENNDVLKLMPDWDNAKMGASLLFWLF
jgi:hypothetical protein